MTEFEQELVRAIEHGCPECGYEFFTLFQWQVQRMSVGLYGNQPWPDYDWDEDVPDRTKPDELECKHCKKSLWTSNDGWIPELAEIVKGE